MTYQVKTIFLALKSRTQIYIFSVDISSSVFKFGGILIDCLQLSPFHLSVLFAENRMACNDAKILYIYILMFNDSF